MKRGQVIIAAVFVIIIVALLGFVIAGMLSTESFSVVKNLHGIQALNIAEGGLRFTITTSLAADSDYSDNVDFGPVALGNGSFSVHYTYKEEKNCSVEVTGTVQGISRTVRSGFRNGGGSFGGSLPFNVQYIQYSGGGGGATLTVNGDARIYGDYYYNGPIAMEGSAQQEDGTIYSTSISTSGTAGYASWEAAPPVDMPAWENTYYDNILTATNSSAASSITFNSSNPINLAGQTLYYRSITVAWGASITGPGTLVATGKPSGTGDITVNYGQGVGSGVKFIANDDFIYSGGSSFTNSVEVYAKGDVQILNGLTVPAGSLLYTSGEGTVGLDLEGPVTATMLAPYGTVTTAGGWDIYGLIFCNTMDPGDSGTISGAIICYSPSTIGGSVHLIEDASYLPPSVTGLEGDDTTSSFEVSGWQEVY
ncbi:MAG: hypothetical protein PHH14_00255 [Candidatus Margulisbacteria bacterium]|nr:hypothetical protein [Candidatus Margulisiibacteriota bacterium]